MERHIKFPLEEKPGLKSLCFKSLNPHTRKLSRGRTLAVSLNALGSFLPYVILWAVMGIVTLWMYRDVLGELMTVALILTLPFIASYGYFALTGDMMRF